MTNPKHSIALYLAWIDSNVEAARKLLSPLGGTDDVTTYVLVSSTASLLANRDVLVRHEGEMLPTGSYPYESSDQYESHQCNCCRVDFPCPTYLDIAQRLDEVM